MPAVPTLSPPQAAAALLLAGAPLSPAALAGEFDLLAEGTPTTYVLDDAGVLNKTTKKSVGDQLKALEVRRAGGLAGGGRGLAGQLGARSRRGDGVQGAARPITAAQAGMPLPRGCTQGLPASSHRLRRCLLPARSPAAPRRRPPATAWRWPPCGAWSLRTTPLPLATS